MSQHWGPPPPPLGDPWGGASQGSGHHRPDHPTMLGPSGGSSGRADRPESWRTPEPPRLWPTVLVTVFFGPLGLIPASIAAGRAREIGAPTGPYWRAFGVIVGAQLTVQAIVLVVAFAPILQGGIAVLFAPPTPVAYGDRTAPSSRPATPASGTRAPTQSSAPQASASTRQPDTVPSPLVEQPSTRTVTALPSASWITILDSMPKSRRGEQEAWAMADGLSGPARVVVVDSDQIPGLNAGYWAISIIGSSSRHEANGWCSVMNRPVGGPCYPRQVS